MDVETAKIIAKAISDLGFGPTAHPGPLEGIAMGLAGEGFRTSIPSALSDIANAINNLADAVREHSE